MLYQIILASFGAISAVFTGISVLNFFQYGQRRIVTWGVLSIVGTLVSGWLGLVYYITFIGK